MQELPAQIARQRRIDSAQDGTGARKETLEQIGEAVVDAAIAKAGGVKEFGSSEDVRKQNAKRCQGTEPQLHPAKADGQACEVDDAAPNRPAQRPQPPVLAPSASRSHTTPPCCSTWSQRRSGIHFQGSTPAPTLFDTNEVTVNDVAIEEMEQAGF